MARVQRIQSVLFLTLAITLFGSAVDAAEGIIYQNPDSTGQICHLRFPAIREETLSWDRPVLKDPSEGDIIDFYGPCDHDPLGRAEIIRQKADARRQRDRIDSGTD